jgi:hypothetical protein
VVSGCAHADVNVNIPVSSACWTPFGIHMCWMMRSS